MPVLVTPAIDNMTDASSPQDSSVRHSELQASTPRQLELRERKPPQRFYYSFVDLSGNCSHDFSLLVHYFVILSGSVFFPLLQEGGFVISRESLCALCMHITCFLPCAYGHVD